MPSEARLPADAMTTIPAMFAFEIAFSSASEPTEEPSDMLMTQRPPSSFAFETAQSIAAMTVSFVPEPSSSSTFAAHSFTFGATPTTPMALSAAATVPATCVPWRWRSTGGFEGSKALKPPW
jgi:hypothetical protein